MLTLKRTLLFYPPPCFLIFDAIVPKALTVIAVIFIMIGLSSTCQAASTTTISIKLSLSEQTWIDSHRNIRVGIDSEYAPYSFRADDGTYKGIAVDYIQHIADILNITVEIVPGLSWADVMTPPKPGSLDIIATARTTEEQKNYLSFSETYTATPLVIMTRSDNTAIESPLDLAEKRIALVKQSSTSRRILRESPNNTYHLVDTPLAGLIAVSKGLADAYIGAKGVNLYQTEKHAITNLKIAANYDITGNGQRFVVHKDRAPIVPILNKVLAAIHEQNGLSIVNKWIPAQSKQSITATQADPQTKAQTNKPLIKVTAHEAQWLQSHQTIRVSNETDWPPYDFTSNGQPTGFSIDYLELIAQKLGVRFEYINGYSWAELLAMIKRRELDVIHPVAVSKSRKTFLNFTDTYLQMSNVIITKKDSTKNNITSIRDLFGKTLAIGESYIFQEAITTEYPEINIHLVKNTLEGLKAVSFDHADAYLDTLGTVDYLMQKHFMTNLEIASEFDHETLGFISYHIATRKDWPILRDLIQRAIDAITIEEKQKLIKKWNLFAKDVGLVNLSPEETQWLLAHQQIRLAIDPDFAPIEFVNAKGIHAGISADYVTLLSELLNVSIDVIPNLSWSEAIAQAKAGKIDLFSAITPTAERRQYLNFSNPYINYPFVILTRNDFPTIYGLQSLLGKKVVVVKDYVMQELMEKHYPNIDIITTDSIHQGLVKVSTGLADAFVGDTATATYTIRQHNLANLKIAAPTEFKSEGHSFGVRKDWPLLVSILNKALNTITPFEHLQISKKWIDIEVEAFPVYWLWIAGISASLLIIFIAHNSILRIQVAKRTTEVSDKNTLLEEEITQKKRFEAQLKASEERLRQFFHATFEMVFFHDGGTIIDVNPATLTITGYSPEEVIGKNLLEFVTEDSRKIVKENMDNGEEGPYEVSIVTKQATKNVSPVEINAKTLNLNNQYVRVVSIRDISERKKIEAELRQHREQLEERIKDRTAQLHLVNTELQKFCYTVSHDLRAPLRSINGFSKALVDDYQEILDETAKGYLARIHANTIHMGELIDDLLTLYRVTNNDIEMGPVNLSAIVSEYADALRKSDATRNVTFSIQPDVLVNGDKKLLRVVVENLLGNAWKYTSGKASAHIEFSHEIKNNKHVYCFSDDGAGFDMRYVHKLFNAFSRLHSYDQFPGNGIGLASVQRIIKRHGGDVWAQGEVDKGASFFFHLAD